MRLANLILGVLSVTAVFAVPSSAWSSDQADPSITCSALDLTPNGPGEDAYFQCFDLDLFVTLNFAQSQFSVGGNYGRKPCGGWPPVLDSTNGSVVDRGDGTFVLSAQDYRAQIIIKNQTAQYSGPEGTYVLSCKPST